MVTGGPAGLPSGVIDPGGEVIVVQVDAQQPVPAQVVQPGHGPRRQPASSASRYQRPRSRVEGDVVADGAAGGLGRDLVAAVGELHRA